MDNTTSWEAYLASLTVGDDSFLNATHLLKHLEDPDGLFFLEPGDEINVKITDVSRGL